MLVNKILIKNYSRNFSFLGILYPAPLFGAGMRISLRPCCQKKTNAE